MSQAPQNPEPLDARLAAIDKIRGTARWLIVVFAAIGAALAGTAPLSNVGKLGQGDWRLWVAVAAATIALAAIAATVWWTTNILLPTSRGLADLVKDKKLRAIFTAYPELLDGYGKNLEEFKRQYDQARDAYLDAVVADRKASTAATQAEVARTDAERRTFTPVVERVLNEGLLTGVRRQFSSARAVMFGGALVAGAAIVIFTWAANPPSPPTPPKVVPATLGVAPAGSGVGVSGATARRLLLAHGVAPLEANRDVASFAGQISVQTEPKGGVLLRYESRAKKQKGRLLTIASLAGPRLARYALHLPWGNTAWCLQRVRATKRTLVLVGQIADGKPGVLQYLALDPGAFAFGPGKAYSSAPCR